MRLGFGFGFGLGLGLGLANPNPNPHQVLTLKRVSDIAGVELDGAVAGSTRHGEGQRG